MSLRTHINILEKNTFIQGAYHHRQYVARAIHEFIKTKYSNTNSDLRKSFEKL